MQITEVKSSLWSMSLRGVGEIVEGVDYINQCIDIILTTRPGQDLLRPEFGCGIFDYLDKPINMVASNMKNEIVKALALWLPEVKVSAVTFKIEVGHLTANVTWSFTNEVENNIAKVNYGMAA